MKYFIPIFMLFTTILSAQENYTISGVIEDSVNGETIFGASIYFEGTTIGVTSNEYGFYSITAPKGNYTLTISYVGFNEIKRQVSLDSDQKIDFEIMESTTELDEVVIKSEEPERASLRKPEMSANKLKIKTIKETPVVLGEVDVIKSIQLLPGVSNNGEGSSGFNVRGGAVDQNLVLLDEAIIYNTSHLLGFFSVFNADAIKDMKLYKGSIPARFGGRTSSVLDIRQKDGNSKEFGLTGGIGLISSRLAAEGPIFGEKGSFLFAGRGSYAHLFLNAAEVENSANFYDFNLKTNYDINKNNKVFISGYYGRDNFDMGGSFNSNYGNRSLNFRWNHVYNDRLFSNGSVILSKYDYELDLENMEFNWISSIENYNLKYDMTYFASNQTKLDFGVSGIYYDFDPGAVKPTSETSPINPLQLDQKKALEAALYINAEQSITDRLKAQFGLRLSTFSRLGGQSMSLYKNNQPVVYNSMLDIYERGNVIREVNYDKNETIESFANLEPRISLAYQLNEFSSIKAGYSRTAQYIHLLSNTNSVTPLDVWTPSGKYIKPQLSDQLALGYYRNFKDNKYSLEIESYYKTTKNRIDYIDGSDLIGNNTIETEILNGESRSYGVEFLVRKNEGRLKGWLAYTLSKSEQRTPGGIAGGPGINNGNWYRTPYDRTHDLSLTSTYKLNSKWQLGMNFALQSGRPVTYPNGQFTYEGLSIASYSDRNSDRLPLYHRMDLSATYTPNRKPNNRWKGEWVFGLYNIYNRKNAASMSFGQNAETGANEATRTAIFGVVPSITYNFKF